MKIQQRIVAILAAAFILSGSFPMLTVKADQQPEDTITSQDSTAAHDENTTEETQTSESAIDIEKNSDEISPSEAEIEETSDKTSQFESAIETEEDEEDTEGTQPSESAAEIEEASDKVSQPESETEMAKETEGETEYPVPDEPPEFHARIVYQSNDYCVVGTFTDFTPDIIFVNTWYSLDGVNWQTAIEGDWNLKTLGTNDEEKLQLLQNQGCLYGYYEPLKSYKAGEIDRFYVKLRITKENGRSYETQSVTIERGHVQPLPEEMTVTALFSKNIRIIERIPSYHQYGKYQLTISADATDAKVYALLPDTLPIEIQLAIGLNSFASCTIDCPVTWKPLSLPPLTAGDSITILDATEEILLPKGTVFKTPLGSFQLDQPLSSETMIYHTDEVRLVLNVSSEDLNPTGVLKEDGGLKISLHQKATGATSIKAYVLSEGESEWSELHGLSLLNDLNLQSSTANGGYALLLRNDQEPYRSYLEARKAGKTPAPFFVGFKFEGGIYDGKQLILVWPDSYEQLPDLPKVGGVGGNEGNVGANNKDNSTESGQRPNLPQTPDDVQKEQLTNTPQTPDDAQKGQQANTPQTSDNEQKEQQTNLPQTPDNDQEEEQANTPQTLSDKPGKRQPAPTLTQETAPAMREDQSVSSADVLSLDHQVDNGTPQKPEAAESGQRPNLPQITQDTVNSFPILELFDSPAQSPDIVQAAIDGKDYESTLVLSNVETAMEQTKEKDRRIPLLPVTTAVAAGGFIGAAVCKVTGSNLLSRIAAVIRNALHN